MPNDVEITPFVKNDEGKYVVVMNELQPSERSDADFYRWIDEHFRNIYKGDLNLNWQLYGK